MQLRILQGQLGLATTVEAQPLADERRGEARFAVQVEVAWQTEHNFYMGLSENLSEGGLFVATYDDLPVGTRLLVTLHLPDAAPIITLAEVRWVRENNVLTSDLSPGVGMQLLNLDETACASIRSFLKGREPLYYEVEPEPR